MAAREKYAWEDAEPAQARPAQVFRFIYDLVIHDFPGRFALLLGLSVLGNVLTLLQPLALRLLVDRTSEAVNKGSEYYGAMIGALILLSASWFGAAFVNRLYQVVDLYTNPSIRALVQKRMYAWLMGHDAAFFQQQLAGSLAQRIRQAASSLLGILDILSMDAVRLIVTSGLTTVLLCTVSRNTAMIFGFWMIPYTALSAWFARRAIVLARAQSTAESTALGHLVDSIVNADVVRSFARVTDERRLVGGYLDIERQQSQQLRWFLVRLRLFQATFICSLMVVLVSLATHEVFRGEITIGALTMVFALSVELMYSFFTLSNRMLDLYQNTGTLQAALETVYAPHEIVDPPGAAPLRVPHGRIELRDVCFTFADGTRVLDGLNLTIHPGEKVGLVGRSGAGKSTLIKLIRRQFELQEGAIRIDGCDIKDVTLQSLNEKIAEVPQQFGMFHRTIRENIAFGRPDAPFEEVACAAARANADGFILGRRTGYDTVIGEGGILLSAGQRQRLAIARALLKDARILILDEATSALDSESEYLIQEALWAVMQSRTVLAIAHRLSTLTRMDRIIYLENGRILETGSHADLLALGGRYTALWRRQSGGFMNVEHSPVGSLA